MKEENIFYKNGRWERIKFLWDTFKIMRKAEKFYLISIKDYRVENCMFHYDQRVAYKGLDRESWESFLCSHFNLVESQKELIGKYKNCMKINEEGPHENL